jgi:hypothetical protein
VRCVVGRSKTELSRICANVGRQISCLWGFDRADREDDDSRLSDPNFQSARPKLYGMGRTIGCPLISPVC